MTTLPGHRWPRTFAALGGFGRELLAGFRGRWHGGAVEAGLLVARGARLVFRGGLDGAAWLGNPRGMRFFLGTAAILVVHAVVLVRLAAVRFDALIDFEEGYVAFAAAELMAGAREPWTTYVKTPYEGGSLITSVLAMPFVGALGPSWLALRLTGMAVSLATLAAAMALGRAWFGERAGLHAGLVLAVGPPDWLVAGTQAIGNAQDGLLWVVLLWLAAAATRVTPARAALFGLAAGWAVAFSLAALPAAAMAGALWLARAEARRASAMVALCGGALLGMALPLVNLMYGIEFYRRRGQLPHEFFVGASDWGAGLGWLASPRTAYDALSALGPDPLGGWSPSLQRAYWAVVVAAWGAAIARPGPAGWRLAAWFGVYLAAFCFHSSDGLQPAYLLVCAPPAALLVGRLTASAGRWAGPALGLVLALHLAPLVELAGPAPPLPGGGVAGDRPRWGHTLPLFGPRQLAGLERAESGESLPALDPAAAHGLGAALGGYQLPASRVGRLVRGWPAERARRVAVGWGLGIAWIGMPPLDAVPAIAALDPPELAHAALLSYGRCLGEVRWLEGASEDLPGALAQLSAGLDPMARAALCRGLGEGLGLRFAYRPERYVELLGALPRTAWPPVRAGLVARALEIHDARGALAVQRALDAVRLFSATPPEGEVVWAGDGAGFAAGSARRRDRSAAASREPASARYHLELPGGRGELWVELAADAPVELWILIDGLPHGGPITCPAGRYWVELGPLELPVGSLSLGVMSTRQFPEIRSWRLLRPLR